MIVDLFICDYCFKEYKNSKSISLKLREGLVIRLAGSKQVGGDFCDLACLLDYLKETVCTVEEYNAKHI